MSCTAARFTQSNFNWAKLWPCLFVSLNVQMIRWQMHVTKRICCKSAVFTCSRIEDPNFLKPIAVQIALCTCSMILPCNIAVTGHNYALHFYWEDFSKWSWGGSQFHRYLLSPLKAANERESETFEKEKIHLSDTREVQYYKSTITFIQKVYFARTWENVFWRYSAL